MENALLTLWNMSLAASLLILAVVGLRLVLKKAPKWSICLLWALVGIRLLCPFTLESEMSVIPSSVEITHETVASLPLNTPAVNTPAVNTPTVNTPAALPEVTAPASPVTAPAAPVSGGPSLMTVLGAVWLAGALGVLGYAAVSTLRLRRSLREAARIKDNIWLCDGLRTPFILGVVSPKIYLPSDLSVEEAKYVLAHERAHLERKDHLWKALGYLTLALHWFNPLCWLAYALLCRDIELACDERVVRSLDMGGKKAYSSALLACSVSQRPRLACPLAFGEVGVKTRVKSVLHYKKPAILVVVLALVVCVAAAGCFLTSPVKDESQPEPTEPGVTEPAQTRPTEPAVTEPAEELTLSQLLEKLEGKDVGTVASFQTGRSDHLPTGQAFADLIRAAAQHPVERRWSKEPEICWRVQAEVNGGSTLLLTASLEENVVRLSRNKLDEPELYVQDEALYKVVRCCDDIASNVDGDALAKFGKQVEDAAKLDLHDWHVSGHHELYTLEKYAADEARGRALYIYGYVFIPDTVPETEEEEALLAQSLAGGAYFDSALRLHEDGGYFMTVDGEFMGFVDAPIWDGEDLKQIESLDELMQYVIQVN